MAYLFIAEGCKGTEIKFIQSNGTFLSKRRRLIGGVSSGTIALQDCGDGRLRITFCDLKNLALAVGKDLFKIGKNFYEPGWKNLTEYLKSNSLCAFTFTRDDLEKKRVVIEYQVQIVGLSCFAGLMCYDLRTGLGCAYMFDSDDEVKKWARELGIREVEFLDASGNTTSREPL